MTLRLIVATSAWRAQVDATHAAVSAAAPTAAVVPVVKGNGYGFGRAVLAELAAEWASSVAVGSVHEAHDAVMRRFAEVLVLTPSIDTAALARLPGNVTPTVGTTAHVAALAAAGRTGAVTVKLASPMLRYGVEPDGLADLLAACAVARLEPCRWMIHPPLVSAGADNVGAVHRWLDLVDPTLPLSVSHLSPAEAGELAARSPCQRFELRLGTALWHGDKSALRLEADVLDVRPVAAGTRAGYRGAPVEVDGALVMVGAGSAHGVAPLDDGRSPFHFARRRLALHEPPHMHTSMLIASRDGPSPGVGDRVDVQRPLISTHVDEVLWQ